MKLFDTTTKYEKNEIVNSWWGYSQRRIKCWWNIDWKISLIYERHHHIHRGKFTDTENGHNEALFLFPCALANCLWMNHEKKIYVESGALDCLQIKMINQKWRVLFYCEKWLRHDRVTAIFQIFIWAFCPPIIWHIKNSINSIILLYVFPGYTSHCASARK